MSNIEPEGATPRSSLQPPGPPVRGRARQGGQALEGWRTIAEHISARIGFDVSIDAVRRWAQRGNDPLPIRRWGGKRPRVVADRAALDAWADRQWRNEAGQEERASD